MTPEDFGEDEVQLTLRLTRICRELLRRRARENRRSLNAYVVTLLERHVGLRDASAPGEPDGDG